MFFVQSFSSRFHRKTDLGLLISLLISCIMVSAVQAQVTLDGSLGTSGTLSGPDYVISDDLGETRGTNLFHSFGDFNVPTGGSATFTGPNVIENVIGRVTGGNPSSIDGLLRSTILDANLFLINPSGVMFGPNASLDVNGSFHVSTADYIALSDGGIFYADSARPSVLTVAPPESFGFLGDNPAEISIQESILQVPFGEAISVVGGNVHITGGDLGYLYAPSGRINITSVASEGEVGLDMDVESFEHLGDINIMERGWIETSGDPAGITVIQGENLVMDDSYIFSNAYGTFGGGFNIIGLRGEMVLSNGTRIESINYGTGEAGNIWIDVSESVLIDDSSITAGTRGDGAAGEISLFVEEGSLSLLNWSMITSSSVSEGDGGDIYLDVNSLELIDGSFISSNAFNFDGISYFETPGQGGDVTIFADLISISGHGPDGTLSGIYTTTWSSAPSGSVYIWGSDLSMDNGMIQTSNLGNGGSGDFIIGVDTLTLTGGAQLMSSNIGSGPGAYLSITAEESISLSGQNMDGNPSGIYNNASGTGDGGFVSIFTPSLNMADGATIQAGTEGAGNGALLSFDLGSLTLTDGAYINTTSYGEGLSGYILVNAADSVTISGQSSDGSPSGLISNAEGSGDGGYIYIESPTMNIHEGGRILSVTTGDGWAGHIAFNVGSLTLMDGADVNATSYGDGSAGYIWVTATDSVTISGQSIDGFSSAFISNTEGSGDGGYISIETPDLNMTNGGLIQTQTAGDGDAGNISLDVATLTIGSGAQVSTSTHGDGQGGTLWITATDSVSITGGMNEFQSALMSDAWGSGDGGYIYVETPDLVVSESGRIEAGTMGDGNGGSINMDTESLTLESGAQINSGSFGSGRGGLIDITSSGPIRISRESDTGVPSGIYTGARDSGDGGDLMIHAQEIELDEGAFISAKSHGTGLAGNITLNLDDVLTCRNCSVNTEALETDGGDIEIRAGYMVYLIDSEITATVGGGPETVGGNITIDPDYVVLNRSDIIANAYEGRGGNVQIIAGTFLADPYSMVSASSELGIDGSVDIRALTTDISGMIAPLDETFLSADALLRDPCAERIKGGEYSSFVIRDREGLPIQPDRLLPSPIFF